MVQSACLLPPSFQATDPAANQQVAFVGSELEPVMVESLVPNRADVVKFRLVADDADANDKLSVRFLRADTGAVLLGFHDEIMTALDPPVVAHPTWRSVRSEVPICNIASPALKVSVTIVVTDRTFANSLDDTVVSGATSNRTNWVFDCQ